MNIHDKTDARYCFAEHLKVAKLASQLAAGGETAIDGIVDDLAECLDYIHQTKEFSQMAEAN